MIIVFLAAGQSSDASGIARTNRFASAPKTSPGSVVVDRKPSPHSAQAHKELRRNPADSWRYRKHDGRWWYWLPTNEWAYWSDGAWLVPSQATGKTTNPLGRRQNDNGRGHFRYDPSIGAYRYEYPLQPRQRGYIYDPYLRRFRYVVPAQRPERRTSYFYDPESGRYRRRSDARPGAR